MSKMLKCNEWALNSSSRGQISVKDFNCQWKMLNVSDRC